MTKKYTCYRRREGQGVMEFPFQVNDRVNLHPRYRQKWGVPWDYGVGVVVDVDPYGWITVEWSSPEVTGFHVATELSLLRRGEG